MVRLIRNFVDCGAHSKEFSEEDLRKTKKVVFSCQNYINPLMLNRTILKLNSASLQEQSHRAKHQIIHSCHNIEFRYPIHSTIQWIAYKIILINAHTHCQSIHSKTHQIIIDWKLIMFFVCMYFFLGYIFWFWLSNKASEKKLKFNFCECAKINKQLRYVWIFKIEDRDWKNIILQMCMTKSRFTRGEYVEEWICTNRLCIVVAIYSKIPHRILDLKSRVYEWIAKQKF